MVINHSKFGISVSVTNLNTLHFFYNIPSYSCHNKRKSLHLHNVLGIDSHNTSYFSIYYDKYWYTRT